MCWTENDFDFSGNRYASEALSRGRWAFLSDYARYAVLEKYGGIYFDTDVELIKSPDALLSHDGFCGVEDCQINSGLGIGAVPHHPVISALLKSYGGLSFLDSGGREKLTTNTELQQPVFAGFGFSPARAGEIQTFSGMTAYPTEYFCPKSFRDGSLHLTDNTYSIHHYRASWASPASRAGYHLRRLTGERLYNSVRRCFKHPDLLILLWCFLLTWCQNLRGVLNAGEYNSGRLTWMMLFLVSAALAVRLILRRRPERKFWAALFSGAVICIASPGNFSFLWCVVLGWVMSGFPFRCFSVCNAVSMLTSLSAWCALAALKFIPVDMIETKKLASGVFCNFGFISTNFISLFVFHIAVFSYCASVRRRRMIFYLLPLSAAVVFLSGGRCYSIALAVLGCAAWLPRFIRRVLFRVIPVLLFLPLLFAVLFCLLDCRLLRSIFNERLEFWTLWLSKISGMREIVCGRLPVDGDAVLDNAGLALFFKCGLIGVITYAGLAFAAYRRYFRYAYRLLPVWLAMLFAGLFETHVFSASMLGLLPFYFFFKEGGEKC